MPPVRLFPSSSILGLAVALVPGCWIATAEDLRGDPPRRPEPDETHSPVTDSDTTPPIDTTTDTGTPVTVPEPVVCGEVSFTPTDTFATGPLPSAIAVADLDRDGTVDLVTADFLGSTVTWAPGVGDGTFGDALPIAFPIGSPQTLAACPVGLAAGDLDDDGHDDVAVLDGCNDRVALLTGGSNPPTLEDDVLTTGPYPTAITGGDFDGDGRLDLAITTTGGRIDRFLGQPGGGFAARPTLTVGGTPAVAGTGDADGDANLDLFVVDVSGHEVLVWSGDGTGDFSPLYRIEVDEEPTDAALADLNADGLPDVLVTDVTSQVRTWTATAGGELLDPIDSRTGLEPVDLEVADLLGDGCWSAVTADSSGGSASLLRGLGDGSFAEASILAIGWEARAVIVAQLDGSGPLDLAVTDDAMSQVHVFVGGAP